MGTRKVSMIAGSWPSEATGPDLSNPDLDNLDDLDDLDGYDAASWDEEGTDKVLDAADVKNIQLGLEYAKKASRDFGWKTVWLVTNTKDDLSEHWNPNLSGAQGMSTIKAVRDGTAVRIDSLTLQHTTFAGLLRSQIGQSILAVHPTQELLDRIDAMLGDSAVTVVPGVKNIDKWIETWGPVDLTTGERRPHLEITDPHVLEAVTNIVTLKTGVSHAQDKQYAQRLFAKLRRNKRNVDPREIRAYVTRETGWGVIRAEQLAKIAAGRKGAAKSAS